MTKQIAITITDEQQKKLKELKRSTYTNMLLEIKEVIKKTIERETN